MYGNLSVLIPFRGDGGHRDLQLAWFLARMGKILPGAELVVGVSRGEEFSRAEAVNHAATYATRDLFLISDCDLLFFPETIEAGLSLLDRAPWVLPFTSYRGLGKEDTLKILAGWAPSAADVAQLTPEYIRTGAVGGIALIPRKAFELVRGMDPGFVGWGCEDNAFYVAVETLWGRAERLPVTIWHLWHRKARKDAVARGLFQANKARYRRYLSVRGRPEEMAKLIQRREE